MSVSRLPGEDYRAFIDLLEAIRVCLQPCILATEIEQVRGQMRCFLEYYEQRYYALQFERLPACLPVFHQLAHVVDFLDTLGPMWVYSQWVMERVCGLMVRTAENHFTANRNMEINLLLQEQRNLIPYLNLELEEPTQMGESSSEIWLDTLGNQLEPPVEMVACEETDSNIDLLNLFINLLRSTSVHQSTAPSSIPVLRKPSFTMSFDGQLTRALKNCLGNLERPSSCLEWSSCVFPPREGNTATVARPFVVTSLKRKKSNSTRSSNFVRVRTASSDYFYGEVIFFFSVAFGADPDLAMAYVRRWKTLPDDNLVYKAAQGHVLSVIHCSQIEELVGLVKRSDRMYVVREMGLPTAM
jgi:hypothetical protein